MSPQPDEYLNRLLTRADLDRLEITAGQISAWVAESWLEQIGSLPGIGAGGVDEPVFAIRSHDIRSYLGGMLEKLGKPAVEMSPLRARSELLRALLLRRGVALPVDVLREAERQEANLEVQNMPVNPEVADSLRFVREALDAEIKQALALAAPATEPVVADDPVPTNDDADAEVWADPDTLLEALAEHAPETTETTLASASMLAVAAAALIDEIEAVTGEALATTQPLAVSNQDTTMATTPPAATTDPNVVMPTPTTAPATDTAPQPPPEGPAPVPTTPGPTDEAIDIAAADTMPQALEELEAATADGAPTDSVPPALTTARQPSAAPPTTLRLADLFRVGANGEAVNYSSPPGEVNPDHLTEAEIAELIIDSSVLTPESPAAVFRGEHAAPEGGAAVTTPDGAAINPSLHPGAPTIIVHPSALDLGPMAEELSRLRAVLTEVVGREPKFDLQPLVAALQSDQALDSAARQTLLAAVQALGGDLRSVTEQLQATNKTALAALATTASALDREPRDAAAVLIERAPRRAGLVFLTVAFLLVCWAGVVYFKTHDLRTTMGGVVAANVAASALLAFRRSL